MAKLLPFSLVFLTLVVLAPASAQAAPTPAQLKVAAAQAAIDKLAEADTPVALANAYARLALAQAQRARETADPAYYAEAQAAVDRALSLAPGHLDARRTRIWIQLGRHEFADALQAAEKLNRELPDDLQTYALLTDARIELGHYADAEKSAQWLLDLRPGNVLGLTRAAYLRELFGDLEGSLDLMQQAWQRTPPGETEHRAWLLTQMAHLELAANRADRADALLAEALRAFPDYHYALAQLARVRQAQERHADAVALLRRHVALAPHPENFFYLGEALARQGLTAQARMAFARFETDARRESASWDNANRELILYYADHARRPAEALRLARLEIARRQDIQTLDAYAWALYRNGKFREANAAIERALAVGTLDPRLHYHAGMIAMKLGRAGKARQRLETALRHAPWAGFAPDARQALARAGKRTG